YDSKFGKYVERKGENFNTDTHGFFSMVPSKTTNNDMLTLEFTAMNDHLYIDENVNQYAYWVDDDLAVNKSDYEKNNLKTFFFTDRAIYRPGQTVYFKGIVITRDFDSKKPKIISQLKTKVFLLDANEEKVDSVFVTTNDFGSYNGKFILPENLLNGEFRISDDSTESEQRFSVEEYKRPKFHVEYETLKGSYRLNDSIRVTGSANAYAGNTIDGAVVKYRVTRQARFPYEWLYWRRGIPRSSSQEIAHGEIKTNADGKFFITFAAIPDRSIDKKTEPVFDYSVSADVTDINGETRSGQTSVSVGYKSLNLSISLPYGDNLVADSLKNIFIKTENLSGEFEPAKVNVSIYKLKAPDRLIRQRYWQQQDEFVMAKEEYIKNFPNDEYSDETKKESWEKTEKVFDASDSTKSTGIFDLSRTSVIGHRSSFSGGWYVIEVTAKDKYGEDVKNIKYIQLHDSKSGSPANPQYNWVFDNYAITEPGKKVSAEVGSSAKDVFVIQEVDGRQFSVDSIKTLSLRQSSDNYSFFTINNEKKSTDFSITENDRGGFGAFYAFVKNNRFYISNKTISVPWSNKELNISYETFRDKTSPGNEEKWKVKVTGYKKDKVAAEVLTSMYDASLDQLFRIHGWDKPNIWQIYSPNARWRVRPSFSITKSQDRNDYETYIYFDKTYDVINVATYGRFVGGRIYGMANSATNDKPGEAAQRISIAESAVPAQEMNVLFKNKKYKSVDSATKGLVVQDVQLEDVREDATTGIKINQSQIQIRKNFNETAFFFPGLKTDSSGSVEFSFAMPEALTQWKWMLFAHTKDLAFGYSEKSVVTQKELMVQPNVPRFLREGDHVDLSTKIVNLTDSEFTGQVELQLLDATTNQPVDGWFMNVQPNQYFTVAAKQSEVVNFNLQIPYQFNKPVTYRFVARVPKNTSTRAPSSSSGLSDGEENTLPVLSNRMLVTESLPLNINGSGKKDFKFEKLLQSGNSETLNNHSLTVEFTSDPAWYAVQALPYLMEFPHECAEQTFNRFYANALASTIVNSSPRIKEIFARWNAPLSSGRGAGGEVDTSALLSNLQKNQELKAVLLQETPWVLQGKTEAQQKKNIALLFDLAKMNGALESTLTKLQQMQTDNGGFPWFAGGPDDRYITQYILTGIGHLKKLHALPASANEKIDAIIKAALPYLDKKLKQDFTDLTKYKRNLASNNLGYTQIQYLYMRSFFSDHDVPGEVFPAMNYYHKQSQQFWLQQNKYMQGMIALELFRTGDLQKAKDILTSLKQNAIVNEELGMYWKENSTGYYWYQSPIEAQSLLIEAFSEIQKDQKTINNLKTWLLKQKQTQDWKTTKATADACYALLLQGTDWLGENKNVEIRLGNTVISSYDNKTEAGTGYFKKTIDGNFVKPEMGNINLSVTSPSTTSANQISTPSWGAVYWQYFENLDKITTAATPLQLTKKLFIERNTDRGPVLELIAENGVLKVGDKIKVRIELKVDRDMEYVHLKDMRAACMEPINVLSEYKWQDGLGYYETTKDASTNFFFNWLPKGTYVFEYPLFVMATGNFSNGVTTIQCMYAPEFTSHSEGIRVNVE
ncbi:MAG: alpha-2-macroglobulin, partial [Bacteroidetes bacterium]|nr:alpha-2-macroglobulin [Bacteroidota bacterium]